MPWPRAKTAPRSVGRVISPPDRRCQRLLSINCRIRRTNFATRRRLDFCGLSAVLEPQSCDDLVYKWEFESSDASGGCGIRHLSGAGEPRLTHRLFLMAEKHREILAALLFPDSGRPSG